MNLQQEQLVEQIGGAMAKNLFGLGPVIQQKIETLTKQLRKRIQEMHITESQVQSELHAILEKREDLEEASHEEQQLAVLEIVKEILDKKGKRKYILHAESQDEDLTEDDFRERLKVAATLMISEVSKEIGRSLTEQEVDKIGEYLLEETAEGRTLAIQQALEQDHPDVEIVATYPTRAIFKGGDDLYYSVNYEIKDKKAELSEAKEMQMALIPKGSIDSINVTLGKKPTGLTEEQRRDRRVAGLEEPKGSVIVEDQKEKKIVEQKDEGKVPQYTEDQKRDRRIAGLHVEPSPEVQPLDEATLTRTQRFDRGIVKSGILDRRDF